MMNWNGFFKVVVINILLIPGLAVIILGLIGFLLAGQEGLKGGATWGLVRGLVSIPFSIAAIVRTKYWEYFFGRISRWFAKTETEGESKQQ